LSAEPYALLVAFCIKLVPFLFFVFWPDPEENPFFMVNVVHTLASFAFIALFFVTVPLLALFWWLAWRFVTLTAARRVVFFVLYYVSLTPPMALFALMLRGDDVSLGV
jgi:hypothetical protein